MRKRLKLQGDKDRAAMAGLLLTVLGCIPLAGCLFPQDEQVIGELPPKRNGPLKIVSQVPQDPRTTFFNSTTCPNQVFMLTIEDEDLADVVNSLWFIGKTTSQPFPTSPLSGGSKVRSVASPNSLGFKSTLANLPTGTEVLTVYVADTAFQEVVDGQVALVAREPKLLPDGSSGLDRGSFDVFTWTLDVKACN